MQDRIIRPKHLTAKVGFGRETARLKELRGEFPRRVDLGNGQVGWRESELDEWIASRPRVPLAWRQEEAEVSS